MNEIPLYLQPPQKGKQATKGAKQIVEENKTTLKFYRNMALACSAPTILLSFLLFEISKLTVVSGIIKIPCPAQNMTLTYPIFCSSC